MDLAEVARTASLIGASSTTWCDAARQHEVVRALRRATEADAALLSATDRHGGQRHVASIGYPEDVAWHAVHTFPTTPWWDTVVAAPLPPSISTMPAAGFTDSEYYARHVAPAGFRDGLSVPLHHHGRCAGMLHLSSLEASRFGHGHQSVMAALSDAIAALVAVRHEVRMVVRQRRVHARQGDPLLRDGELLDVLRQIADLTTSDVQLVWPSRPRWCRIVVRARTHGSHVEVVEIDPPMGITPRELQVLTLVATGATNAAIAEELGIGPRTVHTHVERLLRKLAVDNRTAAATTAVRRGLLRPSSDPDSLAGVPSLYTP